MTENMNAFESLLEKATDYGKTSFELAKLQAINKISHFISSLIPHSLLLLLSITCMLFVNLGAALWLGELMGKMYYGFFAVAIFYILVAVLFRIFLHQWVKKTICNYVINQAIK